MFEMPKLVHHGVCKALLGVGKIRYRNINPPRLQNPTAASHCEPPDGIEAEKLFPNTLHNASVSASPDYYDDANKRQQTLTNANKR